MKKKFVLLVPLILAACLNPPIVVTDTPAVTNTPTIAAMPSPTGRVSQTPAPTDRPAVTDTPTPASDDAPYLPNPAWQPGVYNPDVTQDTIQTTICVSGYTKKIRPPVSYTDHLKVQQIAQYGYSDTNLADYEEDHLIALEDGGHPTDPKNLWPQPRHTTPWGAPQKDTLENVLHELICSGQLQLDTAQQALATDWVAAYMKYVPESAIPFTPVPPEP